MTGESLKPIRVAVTRREMDRIAIAATKEARSVSRFLALRALSYAIGEVARVDEEELPPFEFRRETVSCYTNEADAMKLKKVARRAHCTVSAWIRSCGLR